MNDDEWWMKIIIADWLSENDSAIICLLGRQKNSLAKAVPVQYKWATAAAAITLYYRLCIPVSISTLQGKPLASLSKAVNV